jgi:hypothetical protein
MTERGNRAHLSSAARSRSPDSDFIANRLLVILAGS